MLDQEVYGFGTVIHPRNEKCTKKFGDSKVNNSSRDTGTLKWQ